jgi:hypothetical protein
VKYGNNTTPKHVKKITADRSFTKLSAYKRLIQHKVSVKPLAAHQIDIISPTEKQMRSLPL